MTDDPPRGCFEVHLSALGAAFVLEFAGSGAALLAEQAASAWSWCVAGDGPVDVRIRVVIDGDPAVVEAARQDGVEVAGSDPRAVMDRLSPTITVAAIQHQAGRLVMLHAAGVATLSGATLILVAPSGTGKTTSARRLAGRLAYVTDETLAVAPDGTIVGYPKPLSILEPGHPHKMQVSPGALCLIKPPDLCRPTSIVILDRDASPEPWLEPIAMLPALARLAPETSYLARLARPLHQLADLVDACGGLQVLHYAESEHLVDLAHELLGEG